LKTTHPRIAMLSELPTKGGGAEMFAVRAAQVLLAHGYAVRVFTSDNTAPSARPFEGVPLVVFHYPMHLPRLLRGLLYLVNMLRALWAQRHTYDLIHVHQARTNAAIAVIVGKLTGKPIITTLVCGGVLGEVLSMNRHAPPGVARLVLPHVWRVVLKADHFVGVSEEIMGELRTQPLQPAQLHFIPYGVPAMPRATPRRNPLTPMHSMAVGRLNSQKRFDLLIRAAAQLDNVQITIVGEGAERAAHEALIAAYGVADRVHLTGHVPNAARALLPTADVFVLCSDYEGLPNVLLEAMACGLPCVITPAGGAADVARDGENALVIPFNDADALAHALQRLQHDEALRQRLSDGAYGYYEAHLSMEVTMARHIDLYTQVWEAHQP
jgi:glycosyltransferase involved in cell wall biosynthesis